MSQPEIAQLSLKVPKAKHFPAKTLKKQIMLSSSRLDRKMLVLNDYERHLHTSETLENQMSGPSVSSFFILLISSALAASLSFKVCISILCWWTIFLSTSWHCIRKARKKKTHLAPEPRDTLLDKK